MLETIKTVTLYKPYHYENAELEDGELVLELTASQKAKIRREFEGKVDDKLHDFLAGGEKLLTDAFDDIKEGLDQSRGEDTNPLDDLFKDEESVDVDIDEELETVKDEVNGRKSPDLTFDESLSKFIIEAYGWTVDNTSTIVQESDHSVVRSFNGHQLKLDELAGVVEDEDGNPIPLRDNFADLVEWVSSKR